MVVAYQSQNQDNFSGTTSEVAGLPVTLRLISDRGFALDMPVYDRITIGRELRENHTTIDLTSVEGAKHGISRRHVEILPLDGKLTIQDLSSVTGTWLNGDLLEPEAPYLLSDGDTLQLGKMVFRVVFPETTMNNTM